MKAELNSSITIQAICHGFMYNELEGKGLFGLSGKLTIQPEYQRNYIYADGISLKTHTHPYTDDGNPMTTGVPS